jgi:hypothetical protein
MTDLDFRMLEVKHRLHLAEGFLDQHLEQSLPAMRKHLASLRRAIAQVDEMVNVGTKDGKLKAPKKISEGPPGWAARKLKIGKCPDSSLWFELDEDGHWFTLPDRMAGVLKFLVSKPASDNTESDTAAMRSRKSILEYLNSTGGGREYKRQYVNQLTYRIRGILDKRSHLVVSNRSEIGFLVQKDGVEYVQLDEPPGKKPGRGFRHSPLGKGEEVNLRDCKVQSIR